MKKMLLFAAFFAAMTVAACGGDDTPEPPVTPEEPEQPGEQPDQPGEQPGDQPESTAEFVRGADISWYTEMEADGKKFYTAEGVETPCPQLMRAIGMNAVRLRVWVNPQRKGCGSYSDPADVLVKAKAAHEAALNIMVDFHFSDWWADPSRQEMPLDWEDLDMDALQTAVTDHVRQTLGSLKQAGIPVTWVQVGNETRNGMMHPAGQLWNEQGDLADGWKHFAALYMAGYHAVKEVYPDALVMPHLNHAYENNLWWFDKFRSAGGQMDMIALSHYPQADDDSQSWSALNQAAITQISNLHARYGVPVMVAEFGAKIANEPLAAQVAADFMQRARSLGKGVCAGVFYWEPEVYGNWRPSWYVPLGWGAYNMGAFTATGRPSSVLAPWRE